jgi:hypothetical protein
LTKGFQFDATLGRIQFINDARVVATTDGTLVNVLPTVHTFSGQTLTFPDPPKDVCYFWAASNREVAGPPAQKGRGETCACFITALAQEYSNKTTLMAAPAGADFFIT